MTELNTIAVYQTDHYTYIGLVTESTNVAALMSDVLMNVGGTRTDRIPADPASWKDSMHFRPDGLREPTSRELLVYSNELAIRSAALLERKEQLDQDASRLAAITVIVETQEPQNHDQ